MPLTILEGSTFCVSDDIGDLDGPLSGFFAEDTRFLSRLVVRVNGARPLLLSSGKVEYFSAAFYMRNPLAGDLSHDVLAVERRRFVSEGMQDVVVVENESMGRVSFELRLELATDFADVFAVKDYDFALGDPLTAAPLPDPVPADYDEGRNQFLLADPSGDGPWTQVFLSRRGTVEGGRISYRLELESHERWELRVDVVPIFDRELVTPQAAEVHFDEEVKRRRESLLAWRGRVPQLEASWDDLVHTFRQSVADLASLRIHSAWKAMGQLPAAGTPWFMTVFGRDTIITCLQTLLFGPDLARTALTVLAALQAREDDPETDAEPGKIVHELRRGKAAKVWHARYYGTVDATPLYLILLSEVWRWTDDDGLVEELKGPALRALEWIDRYGDRDGDGFVEYAMRSSRGLDNQSWKDSGDSQRFSDGRLAEPPIAPCEVQGYVYDAKLRTAELAREVWHDEELAERLERDAAELARLFDERFWTPARGGYYVLALDGDKRQVDSLCSNVGHLLWSGIVPPERREALVRALTSDALSSGWGVRTMSTADAAYSPLSYHNGTVWPHDNSLIALGLARYGCWKEARAIVRRMVQAAAHFGYQLPEVFAGRRRADTAFPIAYPTAARPQAWAAGAPVLLTQVLLGLRPDRGRRVLESVAPSPLPEWAEDLRLRGVPAFDRLWDVRVVRGRVEVEPR